MDAPHPKDGSPSDDLSSDHSSSDPLIPILEQWKPVGRSGLLPVLIQAQKINGWLSQELLSRIANYLQVPLSEVYGVADFYAHLYTHPVGKQLVRVCDDVPCYLAGSEKIWATVNKLVKVGDGATTSDGEFTLEIVPCLGHCDHAPVVMIEDQVHESVTEDQLVSWLSRENGN